MESIVGGLTATTVGATRLQHPSTRSPRTRMRDERILFNDFTLRYELFRLRRFGAAAKIASAGPKKPKRRRPGAIKNDWSQTVTGRGVALSGPPVLGAPGGRTSGSPA